MKRITILTLCVVVFSLHSFEQNTVPDVKLYFSWYFLKSTNIPQYDVFTYEFGDTCVMLIAVDAYKHGVAVKSSDLLSIPVIDIEKMNFRKKGNVGAAILAGGLTGALIGVVSGFVSGDSEVDINYNEYPVSAGTKAVFRGIMGAGFGTIIGLAIGLNVKPRFKIKGNLNYYQDIRSELSRYSIKYQQED